MAECPGFEHLLIIPRLRIQNANAVSSPLTHGFPSITAFLGLMWALERKTRAAGLDLRFKAVGVVCHAHQEQITEGGFIHAFRLTRNPIATKQEKKKIKKDGSFEMPSIVEEGRIHLDISLVFAVQSPWLSDQPPGNATAANDAARQIGEWIAQMRVAGGSVIPAPLQGGPKRPLPYFIRWTGTAQDQADLFRKVRLHLLPGSALVCRDDLLDARHQELRTQQPDATRLDAWLSLSRINWRCQSSPGEDGKEAPPQWQHDRHALGWVVPIPVGYGALSEIQAAGSVANSRDGTTPFRFVESLYSVGEWVSPHRLNAPQQLLWYADSQPEQGLYRCRNHYRVALVSDSDAHAFDSD